MFFLENIFVPPIKFCPSTKGGDMVSEHAHTVLLRKILQSNIRLGDAHLNKKDPSMVLARLPLKIFPHNKQKWRLRFEVLQFQNCLIMKEIQQRPLKDFPVDILFHWTWYTERLMEKQNMFMLV
ncbi:uncharacterized protein [Arachis hypogaea]|uniref:uncharacterized protein n=1 Tax=Arachis hypogaea TaxID=3818 RepID=UPI000DEC18DF|nr:uncharacterized protein LOC112796436 [Arachis hypogaea]XP_025694661.1 uncharacterized protein LOC112796436 [Arachis hypogaea]XP_025694662.1 uncharacterized protein LOC112796436 [Arachis hypogaea]XP_025694663.1 uncharacterized protein LOC112796436 [Arachis hypogaea]XP_025694664.1 uncharacterized protein LOC112796436 [Arachis hypogaea]XP_025694665.1 uncharacterized protein LOC112796436 [Arachis hypogaea]XP_025694666.1 uncharacterized protein LOC112796436 [Arachis hypogaea]XP_025694667.1 unc